MKHVFRKYGRFQEVFSFLDPFLEVFLKGSSQEHQRDLLEPTSVASAVVRPLHLNIARLGREKPDLNGSPFWVQYGPDRSSKK